VALKTISGRQEAYAAFLAANILTRRIELQGTENDKWTLKRGADGENKDTPINGADGENKDTPINFKGVFDMGGATMQFGYYDGDDVKGEYIDEEELRENTKRLSWKTGANELQKLVEKQETNPCMLPKEGSDGTFKDASGEKCDASVKAAFGEAKANVPALPRTKDLDVYLIGSFRFGLLAAKYVANNLLKMPKVMAGDKTSYVADLNVWEKARNFVCTADGMKALRTRYNKDIDEELKKLEEKPENERKTKETLKEEAGSIVKDKAGIQPDEVELKCLHLSMTYYTLKQANRPPADSNDSTGKITYRVPIDPDVEWAMGAWVMLRLSDWGHNPSLQQADRVLRKQMEDANNQIGEANHQIGDIAKSVAELKDEVKKIEASAATDAIAKSVVDLKENYYSLVSYLLRFLAVACVILGCLAAVPWVSLGIGAVKAWRRGGNENSVEQDDELHQPV